jgi:hypothetical protein
MNGPCVTFGSEVHFGFFRRKLKERKHFKNLRVEGRLISKYVLAVMGGYGLD